MRSGEGCYYLSGIYYMPDIICDLKNGRLRDCPKVTQLIAIRWELKPEQKWGNASFCVIWGKPALLYIMILLLLSSRSLSVFSRLNLPLAHFPHSYSQASMSGFRLLPRALHTPFCMGRPASPFESATASPEHSRHSPIPLSIKLKSIFCYGLRDFPLVGGKVLPLPVAVIVHWLWHTRSVLAG